MDSLTAGMTGQVRFTEYRWKYTNGKLDVPGYPESFYNMPASQRLVTNFRLKNPPDGTRGRIIYGDDPGMSARIGTPPGTKGPPPDNIYYHVISKAWINGIREQSILKFDLKVWFAPGWLAYPITVTINGITATGPK